jgi:hypothetical protein
MKYKEISIDQLADPVGLTGSQLADFRDGKHKLSIIKKVLDRAVAASDVFPDAPTNMTIPLNEYTAQVEECYTALSAILDSFPDSTQYWNRIKNTIEHIRNQYVNYFEPNASNRFLSVCGSFSILLNNDFEAVTNSLASGHQKIEDGLKQIHDLQKILKDQAGKKVAADYSKIFQRQEEVHASIAKSWLKWTVSVAVCTLALLILSFTFDIFHIYGKTGINYPNIFSKLVVVSLLIYCITFCARQYSVNKNLESINNHRKNALNSFALFIETISPEDANTRNTLILQVAKAIYDNVGSGYLPNQDVSSPNIIELTKYVGQSQH